MEYNPNVCLSVSDPHKWRLKWWTIKEYNPNVCQRLIHISDVSSNGQSWNRTPTSVCQRLTPARETQVLWAGKTASSEKSGQNSALWSRRSPEAQRWTTATAGWSGPYGAAGWARPEAGTALPLKISGQPVQPRPFPLTSPWQACWTADSSTPPLSRTLPATSSPMTHLSAAPVPIFSPTHLPAKILPWTFSPRDHPWKILRRTSSPMVLVSTVLPRLSSSTAAEPRVAEQERLWAPGSARPRPESSPRRLPAAPDRLAIALPSPRTGSPLSSSGAVVAWCPWPARSTGGAGAWRGRRSGPACPDLQQRGQGSEWWG